jgi:hypothetical protein
MTYSFHATGNGFTTVMLHCGKVDMQNPSCNHCQGSILHLAADPIKSVNEILRQIAPQSWSNSVFGVAENTAMIEFMIMKTIHNSVDFYY